MSKQGEREASARGDETVAAPATSQAKVCADCGSTEVVVTTDDPAAEPKSYCITHKPANVEVPKE